MQHRVTAVISGQFENRAQVIAAPGIGSAVECAITALDERPVRVFAIAGKPGEAAQGKIAAAVRVNFKNRSCVAGSAKEGGAVQHTVPALQERRVRVRTICAGETEMAKDSVAAAVLLEFVNRA